MKSLVLLRQILMVLLLSLPVACAKSKPKPESVANLEWGKISVNPTPEEHKKHWELWKSKAIKHFRYKVKVTCSMCTLVTYNKKLMEIAPRTANDAGWVIIEVNNGSVISVKNIDGTPNLDFEERLNIYQTEMIRETFEWIEGSMRYIHNNRLMIYDNNYGFPHYAELLYSEKGPTDVDFRIEIVEFEVLPEIRKESSKELKLNQ
jgi:hypothetical protein